jgi:ABC-2 type transport system permease protein
VVGLFVRLKLRLLAGNLRAGGQRAFSFVLSMVFAAVVAVVGFAQLAVLRTDSSAMARDRGIVTLTSLFVSWILFPLLAFGQDETLDPSRLALYPLRLRQLVLGLVAASATGPWPLATLVIVSGAVVGLASSPGGVVVGLLVVPVFLGLCMGASRLMSTAMSRLLRSRRGRDVVGLVLGLLVVVTQIPNMLMQRGVSADVDEVVHRAARTLRWTPPGFLADAMVEGASWRGLGQLAVVALLAVGLVWLWVVALQRSLVTTDTSSQGIVRRRGRRLGVVRRLVPDGPVEAVATKELRYIRRDPRRRVTWVTSLAMAGVISFQWGASDGLSSPRLVIGTVCFFAGILPAQNGNVLGVDGRFLWFNVLAYRDPGDMRADFAGRQLAFTIVAVPLLGVIALGITLVGGVPEVWAPAVVTAAGVLGVGLGVSAVVSVLLPYAVPDRLNAFGNAAPGQGCLAGIGSVLSMLAIALLSVPVVLPVLGLRWLCLLAPVEGLLVAWIGRSIAATRGYPRLPEVLVTVAPPA